MQRKRPSSSRRETLRDRARELRRASTPAEKLLWTKLQGDQLGVRFRRQYRVERYIIDFYCPAKKLAVELDGDSHNDKTEYDAARTAHLLSLNIREIRFTNQTVFQNVDAVVDAIYKEVNELRTSP